MNESRLPRIYISGAKAPLVDLPLIKVRTSLSIEEPNELLLEAGILAEGEAYAITAKDDADNEVDLPAFEVIPTMNIIKFAESLPAEAETFTISSNIHTKSEVGFATSYNVQLTNNVGDFTTTKDLLDNNNWTSTELLNKSATIDIEGLLDKAGEVPGSLENPISLEISFFGGKRRLIANGRATSENAGNGIGSIQTYNLTIQMSGRFGYIFPPAPIA